MQWVKLHVELSVDAQHRQLYMYSLTQCICVIHLSDHTISSLQHDRSATSTVARPHRRHRPMPTVTGSAAPSDDSDDEFTERRSVS